MLFRFCPKNIRTKNFLCHRRILWVSCKTVIVIVWLTGENFKAEGIGQKAEGKSALCGLFSVFLY